MTLRNTEYRITFSSTAGRFYYYFAKDDDGWYQITGQGNWSCASTMKGCLMATQSEKWVLTMPSRHHLDPRSVETAASCLLECEDPSLRFGVAVRMLGRDERSEDLVQLRGEIQHSPRVQRVLSERQGDGTIPRHPYAKWDGAHWVLSTLVDLGYPPGDKSLNPLREQVLRWLLSAGRERRIKQRVDGRARFCASQEGNAIYSLLALGLTDDRVDRLVERLLRTQWPDGGWNCDRRPEADTSSFHETWLPLRALSLYSRLRGNAAVGDAVERAAQVLLTRSLFKRRSDGAVMHRSFVQLHYPAYWHYDILAGLTVMAEAGYIRDKRCRDALDRLMEKQLADGGFPAEATWYREGDEKVSARSLVDWGPVRRKGANPWITVQALTVLRCAGQLELDPSPQATETNYQTRSARFEI